MEGAQIEHRAEMTSDFPLTAYMPTAHEDKRRQAFQGVLEDLISKHFYKLSVMRATHFSEFEMSPFSGGGDIYIIRSDTTGERTGIIKPCEEQGTSSDKEERLDTGEVDKGELRTVAGTSDEEERLDTTGVEVTQERA